MLLIQFTTLESTLLDVLIDVLTPFNQAQQAKLKKDMQDVSGDREEPVPVAIVLRLKSFIELPCARP